MYPHPLDQLDPLDPLTAHEGALRRFSAAVRDNSDWTTKILDKALFVRWVSEAEENDCKLRKGINVAVWDAEDVKYVYGELINSYKPYVERMRAEGCDIEPDIDGVWRTDNLVDSALLGEFADAVNATLENIPEDQKDWRSWSGGRVLDLVNPSFWPLMYGKSTHVDTGKPICGYSPQDYEPLVKPRLETTTTIGGPSDGPSETLVKTTRSRHWSIGRHFCWLPSEFEIFPSGETKIRSYINNLSLPEQKKQLYPLIERIFSRFVPLFNLVLADLKGGRQHHQRVGKLNGILQEDNLYGHGVISVEKHQKIWRGILDDFSNGRDSSESLRATTSRCYEPISPNPSDQYFLWDVGSIIPNSEWSPPLISEDLKLEGKTVKVIVKMTNIHLTPRYPSYEGGDWHIEGTMAERIVAVGICYYDQENVEDSGLHFRRVVNLTTDTNYPHPTNLEALYDMKRRSVKLKTALQSLGTVKMKMGRAIAFPNVFQCGAEPFCLVDPTKPGYRKALSFLLCDPEVPENTIPSTKIVAPQQPAFRGDFEDTLRVGRLGNLPEDIFLMIMEYLPPPVSLEDAKRYKERMISRLRAANRSVPGLRIK
ncbi:hypothetical protein TWF718_004501 [Orbilia javanica]|uniref:Uncharacterized protein n=1 Tax=Orbilia javanica TaxID=47235 RepID=A0AAN8N2S7_9PEZI